MAVVDLGKLRFDWKGTFSDTVDYEERDVVRYGGDIWFFKRDHAAGAWNSSDADLMLVSADVLTTEGDIIVADADGLQTRLGVDYDFSMERSGNKFLRSVSTIPLAQTISKPITVASDTFYVDGAVISSVDALAAAERDTVEFDLSDASCANHDLQFSTINHGIHGGNTTTHVSTVNDGTTTLLQVSSAVPGTNSGGAAVDTLRTIYTYLPDTDDNPTYSGADFPYVLVQGDMTYDSTVTATLSTVDLGGVNMLLVNGRPAYQYVAETDYTTNDSVTAANWMCFDASGNTTTTQLTGSTRTLSFEFTDGITYSGTNGTDGIASWLIADNSDDVYVYDRTELNPAEGFRISPYVHPQTAGVEWAENKSIIQVHRDIYTGGAWDGNRSWNVIPGSEHTFTPTRSDSKIRYRFNYAYAWYYTNHAIEDEYFDIDGTEQCRWTLNAQYLAGRDNFEWVVDSWGAGVAKPMRIYTRNYVDNSNSVRYHTTYYWDGANSYQNCYAQLEIMEYVE